MAQRLHLVESPTGATRGRAGKGPVDGGVSEVGEWRDRNLRSIRHMRERFRVFPSKGRQDSDAMAARRQKMRHSIPSPSGAFRHAVHLFAISEHETAFSSPKGRWIGSLKTIRHHDFRKQRCVIFIHDRLFLNDFKSACFKYIDVV